MAGGINTNFIQEAYPVDLNDGDILSDVSTSSSWKKYSPLHVTLMNELRASTILHPVHVDVRNESYFYANRKKLRPKRLMHFIIKVGLFLGITVSITLCIC